MGKEKRREIYECVAVTVEVANIAQAIMFEAFIRPEMESVLEKYSDAFIELANEEVA